VRQNVDPWTMPVLQGQRSAVEPDYHAGAGFDRMRHTRGRGRDPVTEHDVAGPHWDAIETLATLPGGAEFKEIAL